MTANDLLTKLTNKEDLTKVEAEALSGILLDGNTSPVIASSLLTALSMKGETKDEILAFVEAARIGMKKIPFNGLLVDTCGTGGDGKNTFNISTATALIVGSCGVKTAKHGNRSASGKCGSADVLEALGANINSDADRVLRSINKTNFAFLFAPLFHPLMKNVGAVRRELKIRTIFNLIGPLLNPMDVKRQIIGVGKRSLVAKLSQVVGELPYDHVLIVHSNDGLDEISIYEETTVYEVKNGIPNKFKVSPDEFKLRGKNRNEITVRSITESKEKLLKVLKGENGDLRKIVLINSAVALYVSGKFKSIDEGLVASENAIDSGKAFDTLNKFIKASNSFKD